MDKMDSDSGMVVKRVSVPLGLEELMETLTKEVLRKKPDDIYTFASDYFARLLMIRNKGEFKAPNLKKTGKSSSQSSNGSLRQEYTKQDLLKVKSVTSCSSVKLKNELAARKISKRDVKAKVDSNFSPRASEKNNNVNERKVKTILQKRRQSVESKKGDQTKPVSGTKLPLKIKKTLSKSSASSSSYSKSSSTKSPKESPKDNLKKSSNKTSEESARILKKDDRIASSLSIEKAVLIMQTAVRAFIIKQKIKKMDKSKDTDLGISTNIIKTKPALEESSDKEKLLFGTDIKPVNNQSENLAVVDNYKHEAATKIQSLWRRHIIKRNTKKSNDKNTIVLTGDQHQKAATVIQALFRGYLTRKTHTEAINQLNRRPRLSTLSEEEGSASKKEKDSSNDQIVTQKPESDEVFDDKTNATNENVSTESKLVRCETVEEPPFVKVDVNEPKVTVDESSDNEDISFGKNEQINVNKSEGQSKEKLEAELVKNRPLSKESTTSADSVDTVIFSNKSFENEEKNEATKQSVDDTNTKSSEVVPKTESDTSSKNDRFSNGVDSNKIVTDTKVDDRQVKEDDVNKKITKYLTTITEPLRRAFSAEITDSSPKNDKMLKERSMSAKETESPKYIYIPLRQYTEDADIENSIQKSPEDSISTEKVAIPIEKGALTEELKKSTEKQEKSENADEKISDYINSIVEPVKRKFSPNGEMKVEAKPPVEVEPEYQYIPLRPYSEDKENLLESSNLVHLPDRESTKSLKDTKIPNGSLTRTVSEQIDDIIHTANQVVSKEEIDEVVKEDGHNLKKRDVAFVERQPGTNLKEKEELGNNTKLMKYSSENSEHLNQVDESKSHLSNDRQNNIDLCITQTHVKSDLEDNKLNEAEKIKEQLKDLKDTTKSMPESVADEQKSKKVLSDKEESDELKTQNGSTSDNNTASGQTKHMSESERKEENDHKIEGQSDLKANQKSASESDAEDQKSMKVLSEKQENDEPKAQNGSSSENNTISGQIKHTSESEHEEGNEHKIELQAEDLNDDKKSTPGSVVEDQNSKKVLSEEEKSDEPKAQSEPSSENNTISGQIKHTSGSEHEEGNDHKIELQLEDLNGDKKSTPGSVVEDQNSKKVLSEEEKSDEPKAQSEPSSENNTISGQIKHTSGSEHEEGNDHKIELQLEDLNGDKKSTPGSVVEDQNSKKVLSEEEKSDEPKAQSEPSSENNTISGQIKHTSDDGNDHKIDDRSENLKDNEKSTPGSVAEDQNSKKVLSAKEESDKLKAQNGSTSDNNTTSGQTKQTSGSKREEENDHKIEEQSEDLKDKKSTSESVVEDQKSKKALSEKEESNELKPQNKSISDTNTASDQIKHIFESEREEENDHKTEEQLGDSKDNEKSTSESVAEEQKSKKVLSEKEESDGPKTQNASPSDNKTKTTSGQIKHTSGSERREENNHKIEEESGDLKDNTKSTSESVAKDQQSKKVLSEKEESDELKAQNGSTSDNNTTSGQTKQTSASKREEENDHKIEEQPDDLKDNKKSTSESVPEKQKSKKVLSEKEGSNDLNAKNQSTSDNNTISDQIKHISESERKEENDHKAEEQSEDLKFNEKSTPGCVAEDQNMKKVLSEKEESDKLKAQTGSLPDNNTTVGQTKHTSGLERKEENDHKIEEQSEDLKDDKKSTSESVAEEQNSTKVVFEKEESDELKTQHGSLSDNNNTSGQTKHTSGSEREEENHHKTDEQSENLKDDENFTSESLGEQQKPKNELLKKEKISELQTENGSPSDNIILAGQTKDTSKTECDEQNNDKKQEQSNGVKSDGYSTPGNNSEQQRIQEEFSKRKENNTLENENGSILDNSFSGLPKNTSNNNSKSNNQEKSENTQMPKELKDNETSVVENVREQHKSDEELVRKEESDTLKQEHGFAFDDSLNTSKIIDQSLKLNDNGKSSEKILEQRTDDKLLKNEDSDLTNKENELISDNNSSAQANSTTNKESESKEVNKSQIAYKEDVTNENLTVGRLDKQEKQSIADGKEGIIKDQECISSSAKNDSEGLIGNEKIEKEQTDSNLKEENSKSSKNIESVSSNNNTEIRPNEDKSSEVNNTNNNSIKNSENSNEATLSIEDISSEGKQKKETSETVRSSEESKKSSDLEHKCETESNESVCETIDKNIEMKGNTNDIKGVDFKQNTEEKKSANGEIVKLGIGSDKIGANDASDKISTKADSNTITISNNEEQKIEQESLLQHQLSQSKIVDTKNIAKDSKTDENDSTNIKQKNVSPINSEPQKTESESKHEDLHAKSVVDHNKQEDMKDVNEMDKSEAKIIPNLENDESNKISTSVINSENKKVSTEIVDAESHDKLLKEDKSKLISESILNNDKDKNLYEVNSSAPHVSTQIHDINKHQPEIIQNELSTFNKENEVSNTKEDISNLKEQNNEDVNAKSIHCQENVDNDSKNNTQTNNLDQNRSKDSDVINEQSNNVSNKENLETENFGTPFEQLSISTDDQKTQSQSTKSSENHLQVERKGDVEMDVNIPDENVMKKKGTASETSSSPLQPLKQKDGTDKDDDGRKPQLISNDEIIDDYKDSQSTTISETLSEDSPREDKQEIDKINQNITNANSIEKSSVTATNLTSDNKSNNHINQSINKVSSELSSEDVKLKNDDKQDSLKNVEQAKYNVDSNQQSQDIDKVNDSLEKSTVKSLPDQKDNSQSDNKSETSNNIESSPIKISNDVKKLSQNRNQDDISKRGKRSISDQEICDTLLNSLKSGEENNIKSEKVSVSEPIPTDSRSKINGATNVNVGNDHDPHVRKYSDEKSGEYETSTKGGSNHSREKSTKIEDNKVNSNLQAERSDINHNKLSDVTDITTNKILLSDPQSNGIIDTKEPLTKLSEDSLEYVPNINQESNVTEKKSESVKDNTSSSVNNDGSTYEKDADVGSGGCTNLYVTTYKSKDHQIPNENISEKFNVYKLENLGFGEDVEERSSISPIEVNCSTSRSLPSLPEENVEETSTGTEEIFKKIHPEKKSEPFYLHHQSNSPPTGPSSLQEKAFSKAFLKNGNEKFDSVPIRGNLGSSGSSTEETPTGEQAVQCNMQRVESTQHASSALPLAFELSQAPAGAAPVTEAHAQPRPRSAAGDQAGRDQTGRQRRAGPVAMETEKRNNSSLVRSSQEQRAATKIQASFRGYQVRKKLKTKSQLNNLNGVKRSGRRKSSGRVVVMDSNKSAMKKASSLEEQSATKIQAGIRGFLVRRRQKKTKPTEPESP